MVQTVVNEYLWWLISLVDDGRADSYLMIFTVAWEMEFDFSIPTDGNRAQDGLDLRRAFERESSLILPDLGPCRVLEFLIGISRRMNYILFDYGNPDNSHKWFWALINNLRLLDIGVDRVDDHAREMIEVAFQRVIDRKYDLMGNGGLFPLYAAVEDQRDIEIWYQMHSWISEMHRGYVK